MARRSLFMMLDIDNTLYEYDETGFGKEMRDLIFEYAETKLHLTRAEAEALSVKYYQNYGLSLKGFVEHFKVDAKDFSDYIHQCSYDKLTYNAPLVDMLARLHYGKGETTVAPAAAATPTDGASPPTPQRRLHVYGQHDKVVHHLYFFTNANRRHARNVLTPLGLKPLFTRPRQPGNASTTAAHKHYDEEGFEDATEWLGFSYEDQWRLTGALRANKPIAAAYEAIYKAIDEEIALDEQQQQRQAHENDCEVLPTAADMSREEGEEEGKAAPLSVASPTRQFTAHKRAHLQHRNMVMVDDTLMNLDAPLALGWSAVWYAHNNLQFPDSDNRPLYDEAVASGRLKVIRHILELEKAIEELALLP